MSGPEPTRAARLAFLSRLASLALAGALLASSCNPRKASVPPTPSPSATPTSSLQLRGAGTQPGYPAFQRSTPIPGDTRPQSPLANSLNAPGIDPAEDVRIVARLLARYREAFQGLPAGTPDQIVNALTGNNPQRLAILPPDHPAINAQGELADRWGTPFFFHQVSKERIEIRSAGPDKELFTADDLETP